ncbi:hypothetical protein KAR48_17685 [bacterium]|nr:hypothetical protein [bacterium]
MKKLNIICSLVLLFAASNAISQVCEYDFLFTRPAINDVKTLSCAEASADLDELAGLISDRHSYIWSVDLDHIAVLEKMKANLPEEISVPVLALQIRKFIQLLGDSHARISGYMKLMPERYIPAGFGFKDDRIFVFKRDKSDLLNSDYPYVRTMDGVSIEEWQKKAVEITVGHGASKSYRWSNMVKLLPYAGYLRSELGLDDADSIRIELESEDKRSYTQITLPIISEQPDKKKAFGLGKESGFLPGNIGYLRIYSQSTSREPELVQLIDEWMPRFRKTDALIIDARQCGGGARTNLKTLFPYFMKPDEKPYIGNVAKLRIPADETDFDPRGKLNVGDKKLKYITEDDTTQAELEQLELFLRTFEPQFDPPDDKFTDWYYYAMNPDPEKYYYDRSVWLLMDWGCGSAGDIFVSLFKGRPGFTLVGTPSSGMSGNSIIFNLKNSDIPVRLSTMASFQRTGEKYDGVGIDPDIYMEAEILDWLEQSDSILNRAFDLVIAGIAGKGK